MFKGVKTAVYGTADLDKAKQWYGQVLGTDPVFDSPVRVVFLAGTSVLVLAARAGPSDGEAGPTVYWAVDDAVSSYRRLCELGAQAHTDLANTAGMCSGTVKDPFGNVVGITSKVNTSEKTIEQRPSDTARGVAHFRFLATLEERPEVRGPDTLAEIFIPEEWRQAFRDPAKRQWFITQFLPPGMYYGHVARTAWFDGLFQESLKRDIPQIVFLGAGYDTRPYRFAALIRGTRIFELDAPPTQQRKRDLLQRADIAIPKGLTFIPTNFTVDSLKDALFSAGFQRQQMTLYIWEGVTYYLPAEAVDSTLAFIRENSPSGSTVCFDYCSTFPGMDEAYGVREQREFMKTQSPGERMQFSIERDRIGSFLSERGFSLAEHLTPEEMQKRYLMLKDGSPAGRPGVSMCYVRATVAPR
jgi:methyltransferase (TIGR00027 family)